MNTIEDRLWEYIDGTCSAEEKISIEKLLQTDSVARNLYEEFLSLHQNLQAAELDEPSMRFTQNVMDIIANDPAPKVLQTRVDKRIIGVISGFFILTLSSLIVVALSQINWKSNLPFSLDVPQVDWSKYFSGPFVQAFAIAIVVLGLISIDRIIQYRRHQKAGYES